MVRVEGEAAEGQRIKLISELNPERAFRMKVTKFQPPRRMAFRGGTPLGSSRAG